MNCNTCNFLTLSDYFLMRSDYIQSKIKLEMNDKMFFDFTLTLNVDWYINLYVTKPCGVALDFEKKKTSQQYLLQCIYVVYVNQKVHLATAEAVDLLFVKGLTHSNS